MNPSAPSTTDALTIGRAALHQLHVSLLRDAPDAAVAILQEVGFAAGAGVYDAFRAWLSAEIGVANPDDLDAGSLNQVLSAFFLAMGWGTLSVAPLGSAALTVDSGDWPEPEPGSAETPMCFFTSGMFADFLGRLSGEPVAVMEVERSEERRVGKECRSRWSPDHEKKKARQRRWASSERLPT